MTRPERTERRMRGLLLAACALGAMVPVAARAQAGDRATYDIQSRDLGTALTELARQGNREIYFSADLTRGLRAPALRGQMTIEQALVRLLQGSGLRYRLNASGAIVIERALGEAEAGSAAAEDGSAEILVTGTNIVGRRSSSSPLQVVDRQEIDRTGATSVFDVLSRMTSNTGLGVNPQATKAGVNNQNGTLNRGYASAPNLRGLGSNSTLTLLNGRRLPVASEGYSVDISIIPLAAVERIEALTDGASSIYGSDAVAGVINVITRRGFEGAESSATLGSVTEGGKLDFQLSQLLGRRWGSGNALLSYTYDEQDALAVEARDFSRSATPGNFLIPASRSHTGYANLRQELAPDLETNVDLLFNDRRTNTDAAAVSRSASTGVPVGQRYAIEGTSLNQTLLSSASLRYQFAPGWYVTAAGTYTWNRTHNTGFSIPNGNTDFRYRGEAYSGELNASGDLFRLPGGEASIAFGGAYRRETFGGDEVSNAGTRIFGLSRDIHSLFAELTLPLLGRETLPFVERLAVDASIRYEHYSDFGSTTNPKIGAALSLPGGLRLRSTWSTSFLAPAIAQLSGPAFDLLVELSDPVAPSGSSLMILRNGSNSDLTSQTADNWSAGVDWAPDFADLTFSVDYYDVRFKGLIGTLGPGADIRLRPDIYGAFLTRNPSTELTLPIINSPNFLNLYGDFQPGDIALVIDNRTQNIAQLDTNGVDARIDYRHAFAAGTLSASLNLTKILRYRAAVLAGQPRVELRDTVNNPASFRARARLGWQTQSWQLNAYLNHVGSYVDNSVPTDVRPVSSWTTADVQIEYRSPIERGALAGLRVALSVSNLFDTDPPFVLDRDSFSVANRGMDYDPVNASPLGRFVSLRISKSW